MTKTLLTTSVEYVTIVLFCHLLLCQAADDNALEWSGDTVTYSAIAASIGLIAVVCVVVIVMCMDCYNAEVDTSNHPACRGGKGGAGGGFYPTNTDSVNNHVMQSSFQTNEYVTPSSNNAPLPYTMIPTHIPEESGFSGYQTAPAGNTGGMAGYTAPNTGGVAGYTAPNTGGMSSYGGNAQATAPVVTGRHVNPLEPEEPPPPYSQALHGFR